MYYNLVKFGQSLKELRRQLQITQKDICNLTNINEDTIRKIETGKVIPKQETLDLLTVAFKKDITELFLNCRMDAHENYLQIEEDIETHLESGEYDLLIDDLNKLCGLLGSNMNQYYKTNIEQTIAMTKGIIEKTRNKDFSKAYDMMIHALVIGNPEFVIECYEDYKYSKLELQILMNVGVIIQLMGRYEEALPILKFCVKEIERDDSLKNSRLAIKMYYNLAYAYHRLDEHEEALYYAEEGITINLQSRSLYGLGLLYTRKGVAQLNLDDPEYKSSIYKAFDFFNLSNHHHVSDKLRKSLTETYNIDL